MAMHFFLMTGLVIIWEFDVQWHPGHENLTDYNTKHFYGKHNMEVCSWYIHGNNSPRLLPRAAAPSALRICVGDILSLYRESQSETPNWDYRILASTGTKDRRGTSPAYTMGRRNSRLQITDTYVQDHIYYMKRGTSMQDHHACKSILIIIIKH